MRVKSFFLIAFSFLAIMGIFFLLNPSYQKSLEAKYFYQTHNYQEAYSLAKEAFELDPYNKMATTIMTQSQYSLRYVNYIHDAKQYLHQIQTITNQDINTSSKAKIRTIAQIMIQSYKKLAPSVVVDKQLIQKAKQYHQQFLRIYETAY